MPRPTSELDDEGNQIPPKFEIKKFYGDVISFTEGELDYIDQVMGVNGA